MVPNSRLIFLTGVGLKASLVKSRYARIHSSTFMCNLPSMIAMILCDSVSQYGTAITQTGSRDYPLVLVPPIKSK